MCLDEKTYERYRYLTIYAGIEKNKLNTYLKKGKNQNIINNRKLLIKNLNEEL